MTNTLEEVALTELLPKSKLTMMTYNNNASQESTTTDLYCYR